MLGAEWFVYFSVYSYSRGLKACFRPMCLLVPPDMAVPRSCALLLSHPHRSQRLGDQRHP